jgi:hypothetical protein
MAEEFDPFTADTAQFPAVPPPRRDRGGLVVVALIVGVLGVVVGVAGVAVAAIALGRSDRAVSLAGSAHPVPPPGPGPGGAGSGPGDAGPGPSGAAPGPGDAGPGPSGAGPGSGGAGPGGAGPGGAGPIPSVADSMEPDAIDPNADFEVAYQDEQLRIQSPDCTGGYRAHIDLDQPRVDDVDEPGSEVSYAGCDPGQLDTDLPFAQIGSVDATPSDCLETIRTAPGRSPIAPADGMTLCFETSRKVVFVTIDDITNGGQTGVLTVTAKAWTVVN